MAWNEKKQRRLNVLRYGLLVVTCTAFALGSSMVFIGFGGLWKSVYKGALFAAGIGVLCTIIYYLYKSYLERTP